MCVFFFVSHFFNIVFAILLPKQRRWVLLVYSFPVCACVFLFFIFLILYCYPAAETTAVGFTGILFSGMCVCMLPFIWYPAICSPEGRGLFVFNQLYLACCTEATGL